MTTLPRPIFVVGCQRSGTTMLRLVLDSHSDISCGPETRFLADLERIIGSDWKRLSQYGFSQEDWLHRIAAFFDGIQSDYAVTRGKQRWADKTPLYALSLDFITRVFPDCQVVHVIRDGRDVAVSHRKRFGYRSSIKSAVKWPRYIAAARDVGRRLPPGRYHELRYEDLVTDAEKTLRVLFDFLDEPWEESVLAYDRHSHDVPEKYQAEADRRRLGARTTAAIYASRVGSFRRELDPLTRLLVWVFGRSTLKELGYT
ncbi:MAG: sulfotransferase family protein [Propionicimonas sp.]